MTGISPATLRMWERRYDGRRARAAARRAIASYDDAAVRRLSAMRALVEAGWSPRLAAEQVKSRHAPAALLTPGPDREDAVPVSPPPMRTPRSCATASASSRTTRLPRRTPSTGSPAVARSPRRARRAGVSRGVASRSTARRCQLTLTEVGGAQAAGGDGSMLASIPAPWAKDADGRAIPTRCAVVDGALVQVVEHVRAAPPARSSLTRASSTATGTNPPASSSRRARQARWRSGDGPSPIAAGGLANKLCESPGGSGARPRRYAAGMVSACAVPRRVCVEAHLPLRAAAMVDDRDAERVGDWRRVAAPRAPQRWSWRSPYSLGDGTRERWLTAGLTGCWSPWQPP